MPWVTVLAAVASFVVLSSGPVYRVRTWWDFEDPLANDATIVVINAAVGLVAFSWLVSQGRFRHLDQRALAVAVALVGWLLLGSLWSLDRLDSFRQSLQIASALTIGAAIAAALGAVWFRWALWAEVTGPRLARSPFPGPGELHTRLPDPVLDRLNVMRLHSSSSAILSAVIFNALIIVLLIPLALRGIRYRGRSAALLLRNNLIVYGVGGLVVPFVGIKSIDLLLVVLHLA